MASCACLSVWVVKAFLCITVAPPRRLLSLRLLTSVVVSFFIRDEKFWVDCATGLVEWPWGFVFGWVMPGKELHTYFLFEILKAAGNPSAHRSAPCKTGLCLRDSMAGDLSATPHR